MTEVISAVDGILPEWIGGGRAIAYCAFQDALDRGAPLCYPGMPHDEPAEKTLPDRAKDAGIDGIDLLVIEICDRHGFEFALEYPAGDPWKRYTMTRNDGVSVYAHEDIIKRQSGYLGVLTKILLEAPAR